MRTGKVRIGVGSILVLSSLASARLAGDDPDAPWRAPGSKSHLRNPVPATPESAEKGKRLYQQQCAMCHGPGGKGDGESAKDLDHKPADLTRPTVAEQSDGELFWKTSTGREPMPSYRRLLSDEERWLVVHFLRTLAPPSQLTLPQFRAPDPCRGALSAVLHAYSKSAEALAQADGERAKSCTPALLDAAGRLAAIPGDGLDAPARGAWETAKTRVESAAKGLESATDLPSERAAFRDLSESLAEALRGFGHSEGAPVCLFRGPEPLKGKEALWIQTQATPLNPYSGGAPAGIERPSERIAACLVERDSRSEVETGGSKP
ncbi:MAG TPA: c-type cytochrome [Planctomycetota bacterium]|nr:c-type cytochrome [Planctomycetota bacterium]